MGFIGMLKYALNSTIGTGHFMPLDKIIREHGIQEFTSDGTFVVPDGINVIWVTACGGGAGGNSGSPYAETKVNVGKSGGSTIVGNLITLSGGKQGVQDVVSSINIAADRGGIGGGAGGAGGDGDDVITPSKNGEDGILGHGGKGGKSASKIDGSGGGGGGSLGNGGDGAGTGGLGAGDTKEDGYAGTKGGGGGGGCGDGKSGSIGGFGGAGGSGGSAILDIPFNVKGIKTIPITVGKGGNGGARLTGYSDAYVSGAGGKGGDGFVSIRW